MKVTVLISSIGVWLSVVLSSLVLNAGLSAGKRVMLAFLFIAIAAPAVLTLYAVLEARQRPLSLWAVMMLGVDALATLYTIVVASELFSRLKA